VWGLHLLLSGKTKQVEKYHELDKHYDDTHKDHTNVPYVFLSLTQSRSFSFTMNLNTALSALFVT
jgi:hypothetical protein